jgi:hypothetical protein
MAIHRFIHTTLISLLVAGMVACGGTQLAGGGIGGTGISQGPITGFGSIFVNGVEFNTNNATIIKDGLPVTQKDLKVGMIVTVSGNIATSTSGTAATVTYAKELQGPITAITLPNTLTVLGQEVNVDNFTKIEVTGVSSAGVANLNLQDTVEVSGFPAVNGAIRATYIEVKPPSADVELTGFVSASANKVVTIGTQAVDISAINPLVTPVLGEYVEVKGVLSGTILQASSFDAKSRSLESTNADKAELQGLVNSVNSSTEFLINGQAVQTSSQTNFNGGTADDINVGQWLEVEGSLANGVLIAATVTFEDDISLEGNVAALNGNSISLDGYPGISIEVNDVLTDGSTNPHGIGDHVKIRGRKLSSSCGTAVCLLATELESTTISGATPMELQGPLEAFDPAAGTITVLGITIDTSPIQSFSGTGITDATSFFNTVKIGDLIDTTGSQVGGAITWQAIELND